VAKTKSKRSDRATISTELQAVLDYWRDHADDADDPESSQKWRAVQLEIERFAVGTVEIEDLRRTLRPWTQEDPELLGLVAKLADLSTAPQRNERQKAQMR
jgi:hypothetical protein